MATFDDVSSRNISVTSCSGWRRRFKRGALLTRSAPNWLLNLEKCKDSEKLMKKIWLLGLLCLPFLLVNKSIASSDLQPPQYSTIRDQYAPITTGSRCA